MKKLVLFIVFLACVFVLLSISGAPGTLAHSSKPISFRGNIDAFGEEKWGDTWYLTIKATVETDSGEIYQLTYTDVQPPESLFNQNPADWRAFLIKPVTSEWEFDSRQETHKFTAVGQTTVPAWWVGHHEKRSDVQANIGPSLGRMVGVYNTITKGTWKGQEIVGGQADFNWTFEKSEYFSEEKAGCRIDLPRDGQYPNPTHWCTTTDGKIKGEIFVQ